MREKEIETATERERERERERDRMLYCLCSCFSAYKDTYLYKLKRERENVVRGMRVKVCVEREWSVDQAQDVSGVQLAPSTQICDGKTATQQIPGFYCLD